MDSLMHFSFYIMPGFGFFFSFIVHLVLFSPFLLPNYDRKGGGNNTQT